MSSLVQISDLHFGAEDPDLVLALEQAIAEIAPDAILVSGDLTQRGKRREFEAAAEFFSRLKPPKLVAAGNHDTPMLNVFTRMAAPFARFRKRVGDVVPDYKNENVAAHTLNTARGVQARHDWSLGVVDLGHAQRVIDDLGAAHPGAARAVVCHHPLITPKNAPFPAKTKRGEAAARMLAEGGVDLIFTGHLHVEFAERLPFHDMKTWAIGAGTALSTRTRGVPAGFNALVIRDDRFDLHVYHSPGGRFELSGEFELERRKRAA